jgi:formylglycine-generating enzyme required for sulfatase activity
MTQPEDRSSLVQLITRLKQAQIDWDAENIADLLWLSRYVEVPERPAPEAQAEETPRIRTETVETGDLPPPSPDLNLSIPAAKAQAPSPPKSASGMPFQTPTAPALRQTLSIGRSLRPLMRKVDSYTRTVLDEDATAEQTAERKFCITVVKPDQERWLEAALVIEHTAANFIWQDTIQEFKRLLEHQGAFRSVNVWYLQVTNEGGKAASAGPATAVKAAPVTLLAHRPGSQSQKPRNLKELVDPAGRRLIWVVSDCISPAWQEGIIQSECLALWAKHGPVAIMQLLPGRLWGRTTLRSGVTVKLSGLTPGAANQSLVLHDVPVWSNHSAPDSQTDRGLKLPIVTLEPASLALWARMVAGFGEHQAPGVWFDEGWQEWQQDEPGSPTLPGAESLVQRFNTTASLPARQLAAFMAIVPLQLPIIYLIQATMLPDSTPLHLAEVFMSGLIQRGEAATSGKTDDAGKTYDFVPDVREQLLDLADRPEAERLLDRLSQYIGQKIGRSIYSFTALLTLEKQLAGTAETDLLQFAHVTKQAVQRLGGEYAAFVSAIDDTPPPLPSITFQTLDFTTAQLVEPSTEPPFPLLQTQTVEIVTIVTEAQPEGLQSFEFTVATLERETEPRPSGLFQNLFPRDEPSREWVIRRQTQRAWQLVEVLDNRIQLEMVAIPAGSFLMGSPKDEPERTDREGPQHEVRVEAFLMGRYPVTQIQWRFVAGLPQVNRSLKPDPSRFKGDCHPVEQVSWYEAVEFCDRLSRHTNRQYRLPTEAEWEYACRSGTRTPFHFGKTLTTELANYNGKDVYDGGPKGQSSSKTTPVDQFGIANAFGLGDMHGNVWEWCQDHWHENYQGAPTDGSAWLSEDEGSRRIRRGGSWNLNPRYCRSTCRNDDGPGHSYYNIGFRAICVSP